MARKTFLCLALLIGIVLSASPVLSCEKTLFGPKTFTVGRFHFCSSFDSFRVEKPVEALLEISNANSHGKIHNGYINLNGRFYSLHPILHSKDSTMQVPVQLRSRNYLFVFLYGQRGGAIKLKVKEATQEPTNREPVALDQAVELDEDTAASITLAGSDQDSDPLTFRIISAPAHGTLSGEAPALTYTPSADYNGSDTFTFMVNDGQADSKSAAVNITIKPVNDAPVAAASPSDQPFVGKTVVLDGSHSSDVDGDTLSYQWALISSPLGITPVIEEPNSAKASFVPMMAGDYEVKLVVNDGTTASAPETVTISVAYPPFALTEEKLTADGRAAQDRFGSSVALDNRRALIGAEGKETAYLFESDSPWTCAAQLLAADGAVGHHFGAAVALSGDHALVGAFGDDDSGEASGSAYIFKRDGTQWTQAAKLVAGDGKAGDFFGAAVSISGDYAVVGAYGTDTHEQKWVPRFGENNYVPDSKPPEGMAWNSDQHVWENKKSGQFKLQPNPAEGWADNFRPLAIRVSHTAPTSIALLKVSGAINGSLGTAYNYLSRQAVTLSGVTDIGLIYAYYPPAINNIEFLVPPTGGGRDAGSAYVFKREGRFWTQQAYLTAKDGSEGDAFGISVAISDQTILVGADRDDDNGEDSGSAYVFYQDGVIWVEEAKLLAEKGKKGDRFGASVALSGNIAVVGAPHSDAAAKDSGAAYVFRYNGQDWIEESTLFSLDGKAGDLFGASVSISNDYVVVGAPAADGSGALYVFKFDGTTWNLEGKVVPADRVDGREFGSSVSISGDLILSGAPGDDNQAGAAYAYVINTYHTATIDAKATTEGSFVLSWSWVNALFLEVGPGIVTSAVPLEGSGSTTVTPSVDRTYTITAYGPYGKDVASVTVVVEP